MSSPVASRTRSAVGRTAIRTRPSEPSLTSTISTPRSLRSLAPWTSLSTVWPRGGSSSTVTTNSRASSLRWSGVAGRRVRSPADSPTAGVVTVTVGRTASRRGGRLRSSGSPLAAVVRGDGQVGDRADRFDGERDLGEIGERLDDEGVDATLEEPLRLLPERGARVLRRHAPEGRQVLAERTDGAENQNITPGRLAHVTGEPDAAAVDLSHLALEPVHRELEAVGAEGVGLDQVGPRGDVVGVDRLHEPRVVQVEDVEARVERRSEEHTSELQSHSDLVCRLLLEKNKQETC